MPGDQESKHHQTNGSPKEGEPIHTTKKPIQQWRTVVFRVYVLVVLVAFILLALSSSTTPYFPIDLAITKGFQDFRIWGFTGLMRAVSWPGYPPQAPIITGVILLILYIIGSRRQTFMAASIGLGVEAIDVIVKIIVHRPRPSPTLVHVVRHLDSYSFPSGHVTYYTAFLGFLLFLSCTEVRNSWVRIVTIIIFTAMIVLVGPSRIYLGEHWASDVLGGYLLGSAGLLMGIRIYNRGKARLTTDD